MRKIIPALIFLFSATIAHTQVAFTPGNIAFLQVDASSSNTTGSIIEINTTTANQTTVNSIVIPGMGAGALRFSGSATSTGYVANSNDGTSICFTGVNTTNTSANINTLNPRAAAVLNAATTFSLPTTYTGVSGNQTRGATTLDNTNWFIADQGGLYTNGTTSASPSANLRGIKPFGGTVYTATASSTSTVIQVNTISAVSGATLAGLPGLTNNANLQDFYLISSGSNGTTYDILYTLSATSNTAGTIAKFSLVGGSWVANGTYTTTFGGFGLAAQPGGGGAFLYVSSGQGALIANNVIKLTDAAGYNAPLGITTGNNTILYTAPALKIIKGIAFSPIVPSVPTVSPSSNSVSFPTTASGSFSAPQTITLTASNLTPAAGTLNVAASNTNFQVSNNGTTWGATTTVSYSGSGSTIGNIQARFSPQSSGPLSGNFSITGGGLAAAVTVSLNGTGTNSLSLLFSSSTTSALNPPYITGTVSDAGDPAQQQGIAVDVEESSIAITAANYTITASSSNTGVLPNGNIAVTKSDGQALIKITAAAAGYSDITLTLTKGTDNTTLLIHYASSLSASAATHWHTVFADASGAIPIDDDYMIVCNDEANSLYVYPRNQSGLPVKSYDFNQGLANILALTDGAPAYKEVDVEAGTSSPVTAGKTYWLGSMSNSSSFNDKPNRNRIFAVTYSGTGAATTFGSAGYYSNMRQQLIAWGDANGYNFSASAVDGHDPKLIDGFNLEGMVFGPDNSTLYLGFRAPLVPVASRTKAVIAPIQNFEAWFGSGSPAGNPTIGAPIELDLGGRGIRDIIRLTNGNYIIVAGSYNGTSNPAVYTWTGNPADAPQSTSFDLTGLNAEGVVQVNVSGSISPNKLQIICDDGDKVYYADGIAAKDLSQDNFKKFSSDIITSSVVVPVEFVYLDAAISGKNADLKWQVGADANLQEFEVLRSANGRDFIPVAVVPAISGTFTYSYTDLAVPGQKLYYRIAAKETNDHQSYSVVRLINLSATDFVSVYPNPVTNNIFTVDITKAGDKTVQVFSAEGSLYRQFRFNNEAKDISTAGWLKGYYFVRVTLNDWQTITKKLIIP